MSYPTYLHPGVAKSLLAQSRAKRAVVLAKRNGTYREPTHEERVLWLQNAWAAAQGVNVEQQGWFRNAASRLGVNAYLGQAGQQGGNPYNGGGWSGRNQFGASLGL